VSTHEHTTPLVIEISLLPIRGCGTIYHLSCNRTSATDNSDDNWKHFCSGLTNHGTWCCCCCCCCCYYYYYYYNVTMTATVTLTTTTITTKTAYPFQLSTLLIIFSSTHPDSSQILALQKSCTFLLTYLLTYTKPTTATIKTAIIVDYCSCRWWYGYTTTTTTAATTTTLLPLKLHSLKMNKWWNLSVFLANLLATRSPWAVTLSWQHSYIKKHDLGACRITTPYIQRLWFMPPTITDKQTYKQTDSYTVSSARRAKYFSEFF